MRLSIGIVKGTGLVILNPPGAPVYQPLRGGHGDLHLYWQPVYQDVIRSVGPLAAFLPSAIHEGSGDRVMFSHMEKGRDILSLTRPLGRNEGIPDDVLVRLDSAIKSFKAIARREGTSPDIRRFVEEFTLPSISRFPDAYRVYQPTPFSRRRYFILWGFEPIGMSGLTREDVGQVQMELRTRESSVLDGAKLFARFLAILCLVAAIVWLAAYLLLPEPKAGFSIVAEERKPSSLVNQSYTIKTLGLDYGQTSYLWTFEGADISQSQLIEPAPIWQAPGSGRVSLKVTHASVLWLSKSHTAELTFNVTPSPDTLPRPVNPPPQVFPVPPVSPQEDEPGSHSVDPLNEDPNRKPNSGTRDGSSQGGADPKMPSPGLDSGQPEDGKKAEAAPDPRKQSESGKDSDPEAGVRRGDSGAPLAGSDEPRQAPKTDELNQDKKKSGASRDTSGGNVRGGTSPSEDKVEQAERPKILPLPPMPGAKPKVREGDSGRVDAPRSPEGRYPIGSAIILWYGSRAEVGSSDRLWATLDVEAPDGYKVVRVGFDGASRPYEGQFEQLVQIGPNTVEIELAPLTSVGRPQTMRGIVKFNRPFDIIEQPGSSPEGPSEDSEGPRRSPNLDPSKIPSLTPGESA